jgi:hypothetical protein
MSIQQSNGAVNLQAALNRLVKAGTVDPNILLKYSQNPPPDLGDKGALLVSLASSIVARNKQGSNASMSAPTETVSEQLQNKLAQSDQPQGLASIAPPQMPQAPTEMMAQAPQMPQAPTEMMAEGGVADLNVGDMFNEQNYADGGIVAFANKGLVEDSYADFMMPIPKIPTADDLLLETQDLKSRFIDPDFYKKRKQELEDQTREDINESKAADKANILFKLAEGFGTTPGGFVKGAVAAGVKAGPAVADMNKNIIAAKRLNRAALNDLEQARYAESIGDFKTAAALRESARTKEFEAQKNNAAAGATVKAANIKAGAVAKNTEFAKQKDALSSAKEQFKAQFGDAPFATFFGSSDKAVRDYMNALVQSNAEYYRTGTLGPITVPVPKELLKLQQEKDKNKNTKKETKAPVKETQAQYINRRKEEKAKQKYPLVNKNYDQTSSDVGGNVIDLENAEAMRILEGQGAFDRYDTDQGL